MELRVLNQCIQLVKLSEMPAIDKLQAVINLIQVKRLLLDDGVSDEFCSEESLNEVLGDIKKIYKEGYEVDAVSALINRLSRTIDALSAVEPSRGGQCPTQHTKQLEQSPKVDA